MKSAILSTAEHLDAWRAPMSRRRAREQRRLVSLLVHTLYHREHEADEAGVFPHERMTVDKLRQFVESFLAMGYTFVAPAELMNAGRLPDKAMMLTFDDGYYSFVHALPLLREYQIPAAFFVCPGYVESSQSFWWDAIYRNARKSGASESRVRSQISRLRRKPFEEIHAFIDDRWGKNAMQVATDLDRPLALDELKCLACDPLVHFGNHTFHHTALPFQSQTDIEREIRSAEKFFERELGHRPRMISYPNGDYTDSVVALCRQLGYELGMTIEPRWQTFEELGGSSKPLALGRYMLSGDRDVNRQAKSINLPHSVSATIRRLRKHRYK